MYIKKLTIWLFMLLSVVLAACSDIRDIVGGDTPDVPSEGVVLTLKLPNFTKNTVATRATEQQQIKSLCVLCYDADNYYLGMSNITGADIKSNNDGKYKVKVKVMEGTATLHVVANATITESDAKDASGKINLYNAVRSTDIDLNAPVCWGSITVTDLLSGKTSLTLVRQFAKASVTKDESLTNFEITGFRLFNTASSGTIASELINKVALPSVDCSAKTAEYVTGEQPFYETPADKAYMIIRAKYDGGAETYYKVAFKNKTSDGIEPIILLRNHHYQVKVTAVNHEGWSKEQEAIDNPPENRLSVVVVDDNPPIVDMIACKDYELGVCGEQTVDGNVLKATVTFVTTKQNPEDFSVVSNNTDWISVPTDYKSKATYIDLPTKSGDSQRSSTGRLYTVQLTLSENFNSVAHTGKVTITSGDLSRNVNITQLGYDFRHDDKRKVKIRGLENNSPDLNQDDYFKWMDDNSLKGIRPEQNQGRVRNDGLHFFVGKNQVYYLIPKCQGDQQPTYDDSRVKVEEITVDHTNFYKVTLAAANNYNRWISNLTITTITNARTKITVTYPIYHVGLFAKLTGDAAGIYQLGNSKASGWYYYEMVNVEAGGKTYHMLDRNLGATNNGYYSPATSALEGNVGAIGGYFIISKAQSSEEAKNKNDVVDALAIGNFKVCDNTCLHNLIDNNVLKVEAKKTDYGETYNCISMSTVNSEIPEIYIPMSGYYESNIYKDSYHANLWTRSRLSDYQGFSEKSPEYGFWYLYLDAFGKSLNLSNYRFVSGSSGMNTHRYRAMPVRLVAE